MSDPEDIKMPEFPSVLMWGQVTEETMTLFVPDVEDQIGEQ